MSQLLITCQTGNHDFLGFHLSPYFISTNSSHLRRPDLSQDIRQKLIQKNCLKKIAMDPIDPIWSDIWYLFDHWYWSIGSYLDIQYWWYSIFINNIQYIDHWSNEFLLLWYLWCRYRNSHRAIMGHWQVQHMHRHVRYVRKTRKSILMLHNFVCRCSMTVQHLWLQRVFQPGQCYFITFFHHMGVSENSVSLNPMVLLSLSLLNGYFIGNIPNIFRQTHIFITKFPSGEIPNDPVSALAKELKFRKRTVGDCCLSSRDDLRVKPWNRKWHGSQASHVATHLVN